MLHFQRWKTALIIVVVLFSALAALPNLVSRETLESSWPGWLPGKQIVLGLDLQGGAYLLYQVDTESYQAGRLQSLQSQIRNALNENPRIRYTGLQAGSETVQVRITDPADVAEAQRRLGDLVNPLSTGLVGGSVNEFELSSQNQLLTMSFTEAGLRQRLSTVVDQSIEVIRRRVDELGTTEPNIQRQGQDRILVEAPGEQDPTRLKNVVGQTAQLTFHLVDTTVSPQQALQTGAPPGSSIYYYSDDPTIPIVLYDEALLTGEDLVDASVGYDQSNRPVVNFRLNTSGARTFGQVTASNVGRPFAIVLDDGVISAPTINGPIPSGTGQISGGFTVETANDLAVLLRAGALPARLEVVEERSVGASLGADSIRSGITAGIVAGVLVIGFMAVAYGLFGVFADLALVINIVIMLGALSLLGATLTLPGIAGIVLTIGMAVDANVLIYERIREELNAGKSIVAGIQAGFQRAWGTIIDSHLTQLIAAVVLYFLGSGPVQGFAVTLALGILTSLFTAYTVTLQMVAWWYRRKRPKTLNLQKFRFIPDGTRIPFMTISHYVIVFSLVMMAVSIGSAFVKGFNLGIDFKGGSAIEIQHVGGPADPAEIREALGGLGLGDIQVQNFGTPEDVLVRIEAQPGGDEAQQVAVERVRDALADENYEIRRTEIVGPSVSGELAWHGTIAVLVALGAILIYVWFRFEWQFALAAITTTTHDIILTVGLFSITGIEFNLTSIAAVLTLVGLSLNETVVISDRVRENLRKYKKMPLPELINLSINSTLTRTSLTAFTIFLALIPLVLFGGEVIRGFTIAMTFGVFVGTYSSIIVGGPILIYFGLKARGDEAEKSDKDKAALPKSAGGAAV